MPRQATPRMNIGYGWLRGEDWWGDPMSDNMVLMDCLLHPYVETMALSAPPITATAGQQYIVGLDATGLWADEDNSIAIRYSDRWRFIKPFAGLRVFIKELNDFYWFNGEMWTAERDRGGGVDPNGKAYDILCSVGYPPEPEEVVLLAPIPEAMTLPKDAVGSIATSLAAPAVGVQVKLMRNGSQFGTVTFPSNDFTANFTVTTDVTFTRGDRLTVEMGTEVPDDFGNFAVLLRMMLPSE